MTDNNNIPVDIQEVVQGLASRIAQMSVDLAMAQAGLDAWRTRALMAESQITGMNAATTTVGE